MDKFQKINVGDIVYYNKEVKYGFQQYKFFFIPIKVTRVTKTQFILENGKKCRKNGGLINEYNLVYDLGEKIDNFSKKVVTNQTSEYNDFMQKLKIEQYIRNFDVNIHLNSKLTIDELNEIKTKLDEVSLIIKQN